MGAPLRKADVDVGGQPPRGPSSPTNFALPIQWVGMLLLQTVAVTVWLDHRFGDLEAEIRDQGKELRAEIYHQQDANRDLALRDQRIDELTRRIAILEDYIDAKGHAR